MFGAMAKMEAQVLEQRGGGWLVAGGSSPSPVHSPFNCCSPAAGVAAAEGVGMAAWREDQEEAGRGGRRAPWEDDDDAAWRRKLREAGSGGEEEEEDWGE